MNSKGYIYDGTFEGLLTCIYEAYYRHENPMFILSAKKYTESIRNTLFSLLQNTDDCWVSVEIQTDLMKAEKVYNAIENKISEDAIETIYHVFLSEIPNFEIMTLDYVHFGFRVGRDLNKCMQDKIVMDMLKTERKVVFEVHRMEGFLRFEEKPDFFYAAYEPDYNITSLVTPHFVERFPGQNFIIHDIKRQIASVYNKRNWYVTEMPSGSDLALVSEKKEIYYSDLWRGYFDWASIEERKNLKNQKRQMPKRYWKHLTEVENR
ncbi:MAG: TIGR03915 family putative DNA repair protein [Clostridiaceae bacterium]